MSSKQTSSRQPSKGDRNYQVLQIDEDAAKQLQKMMESLREEVDLKEWAIKGSQGITIDPSGVVMTYEGSDMAAEDIR